MASTPAVAHAMATITSDAPSLVVGAALCLVAVAVVRGRAAWWWLVPAAAATTAVKATGLTVVGLVAVFLLLYLARQSRDRSPRRIRPTIAPTSGPPSGQRPGPARRRARPPCGAAPSHLWLATAAVLLPAGAVLAYGSLVNALTDLPAAADITMREYFHVDSIGYDELIGNVLQPDEPAPERLHAAVHDRPDLGGPDGDGEPRHGGGCLCAGG